MGGIDHSGAKSVTPGGSVAGGHTKGPWYALGDRVVSAATYDTIAGTGSGTNGARTLAVGDAATTAEEHGNARLIAAAPDHHAVALELERLMLVIESAVRFSDPGNLPAVRTMLFANRAAIAKATAGETRNAEPIHRRDGDEG